MRGLVLPPCSPDLNPIEQTFAKIKRGCDDTCLYIGGLVTIISPNECSNCFKTPEMLPSKRETLSPQIVFSSELDYHGALCCNWSTPRN